MPRRPRTTVDATPPTTSHPISKLPPELFARIISHALPATRLRLNEKTYTPPRPALSRIRGSPQAYRHRLHLQDQWGALEHWDIDRPRGRATIPFKDLLKLRLVSRAFSTEVDRVFFGTCELSIKFEVAFVAFLERLRSGENYAPEELWAAEQKQPVEETRLLAWLTRFRHLKFILQKARVEDLPKLGVIVEAACPVASKQVAPAIELVVCGFTEYFVYGPSAAFGNIGDGTLPSVFEAEHGIFRDVSERAMSLWSSRWSSSLRWSSEEMVFYKIDWEAALVMMGGGQLRVKGCWIHSATASGMRLLLGADYDKMVERVDEEG